MRVHVADVYVAQDQWEQCQMVERCCDKSRWHGRGVGTLLLTYMSLLSIHRGAGAACMRQDR